MSEEVPEKHADVFPLEGSEHNSEQNVSCLFGFYGIRPFFLKLWKRSLKLLPICKCTILLWIQLFRLVGLLDQWIDPGEENFSTAAGLVMSRLALVYLGDFGLVLGRSKKLHLKLIVFSVLRSLKIVFIFRGHLVLKFRIAK